MKTGLWVKFTPTFVTEELSADRSMGGVGRTLCCRGCLGDEDDAMLRVAWRAGMTPGAVGACSAMGRLRRSHGRTFSDNIHIFCAAY